jgi:hypothetical protein
VNKYFRGAKSSLTRTSEVYFLPLDYYVTMILHECTFKCMILQECTFKCAYEHNCTHVHYSRSVLFLADAVNHIVFFWCYS